MLIWGSCLITTVVMVGSQQYGPSPDGTYVQDSLYHEECISREDQHSNVGTMLAWYDM